jgi:predicted regulator of Ras-like GTPase activity (Roadblock/LC7/MglB family)
MDATAALERLREISSQVRTAVVFDRSGAVLGSTLADEDRARELAREAGELLAAVERRGPGAQFAQLEVALQGGSVFVVGHDDRLIAATTPPEPTVGLVFYDLKSCLRELAEPEPPKPTRSRPAKPKPKPKVDAGEAKPKPKPSPKPRARKTDAQP